LITLVSLYLIKQDLEAPLILIYYFDSIKPNKLHDHCNWTNQERGALTFVDDWLKEIVSVFIGWSGSFIPNSHLSLWGVGFTGNNICYILYTHGLASLVLGRL